MRIEIVRCVPNNNKIAIHIPVHYIGQTAPPIIQLNLLTPIPVDPLIILH